MYIYDTLIQQIAKEWKLCREVKDANKSSQSVDNEQNQPENGSDNQSDDGFFIEIYDPKGLVNKEKHS